jgi:hypothetical protein
LRELDANDDIASSLIASICYSNFLESILGGVRLETEWPIQLVNKSFAGWSRRSLSSEIENDNPANDCHNESHHRTNEDVTPSHLYPLP